MSRRFFTKNYCWSFEPGYQSSNDPEVFGMYDEQKVTYILHNNQHNLEKVKMVLDEQYDILGVPTEERRYEVLNNNELEIYIKDLTDKYVTYKKECKNLHLPLGRIPLGIVIYNELINEGYCELEAELS